MVALENKRMVLEVLRDMNINPHLVVDGVIGEEAEKAKTTIVESGDPDLINELIVVMMTMKLVDGLKDDGVWGEMAEAAWKKLGAEIWQDHEHV